MEKEKEKRRESSEKGGGRGGILFLSDLIEDMTSDDMKRRNERVGGGRW